VTKVGKSPPVHCSRVILFLPITELYDRVAREVGNVAFTLIFPASGEGRVGPWAGPRL